LGRLPYAAVVLLAAALASAGPGARALPDTDPAARPGVTAPPSPAASPSPTVPAPADSPTPGPTTPPPRPPRTNTLTVVAAGDLFVPPLLTQQAAADAAAAGREGHDFTEILAAVRPVIQGADLAVCHLEQPLAEPEGPFPSFPYFAAPPQLADAIAAAGFDTCSTASNHSLDSGMAGIVRTLDHLDRVGVAHTGTARSEQEAATLNMLTVRRVPVAHLSYTFSFNGLPLPAGSPWAANLIDVDAILAQARRARQAGAEIVILSLHWGTEYQVAPDIGQTGLARQFLTSPDIDLIVGHHVHVVQPFERIDGKWAAYGLGNLTTRFPDGSGEPTQDSVVPRFTFTETSPGRWEVTEVEVVAAWMEYRPAARVVNLAAVLAGVDPAGGDLTSDQRDRYRRAFERISGYVGQRGAIDAGLRMVTPDDIRTARARPAVPVVSPPY
jgi:poly-gamma-glutamate synthesis protein (capsule biosynthesis protein)